MKRQQQHARDNKQSSEKDAQTQKRKLNSREKTVHPDTVKAVQHTAKQYKNVLVELANR